MARRFTTADGETWTVAPSGRLTQYGKDEFGLRFRRLHPAPEEHRLVRYSPLGSKNREQSLAELSDDRLRDLLRHSQPAWTAVEAGYGR